MAIEDEDGLIADGRWTRLEVPGGRSLEIVVPPPGDQIGDVVAGLGEFFPPSFDLALGLLDPGAVVLDLGAHIGTFSLAAAARGLRVVAVEASPRNAAFLRASVRANGLDDMVVVEAAVSDTPGVLRFRPVGAWGHVTDRWAPGVVEVQAQPVSHILREHGIDRVDLVKLDVEGSEMAVIRGMRQLLTGPGAPPVVYENNAHTQRMVGATPQDLIRSFAELGYANYLIGEHELFPVESDSFQPDTCVDYLAVKDALRPPPNWTLRGPRTENELARAVAQESTVHRVDERAQVARSLARAPEQFLARRDIQLAVASLALDPDDTVARAAEWWTTNRGGAQVAEGPQETLQDLADLGRALHNRIAQIRIRWGFRP